MQNADITLVKIFKISYYPIYNSYLRKISYNLSIQLLFQLLNVRMPNSCQFAFINFMIFQLLAQYFYKELKNISNNVMQEKPSKQSMIVKYRQIC